MGGVQGIIHLGQGLVVRTLTMQGSIGGHLFSTCAKFPTNLIFLIT